MAKLSTKMISSLIIIIIILIIVFSIIAETGSDVGAAAGNMTCTDVTDANCIPANTTVAVSTVYPLTNFFKKKGIILLAFMAGIALTVILAMLKGMKGTK